MLDREPVKSELVGGELILVEYTKLEVESAQEVTFDVVLQSKY
jgi:hypothetical protein